MSDNIWNELDNEQLRPKVYFGQVFVDAFYVYIKKGDHKELFDPGRHPESNRFKQIKIDAVCSDSKGGTYTISREIIPEFGREWAGIVLPSLKACNMPTANLNEKWAKFERAKTGETYTNDYGTHEAKTFKFLAFFDSEDECKAAEKAHYNRPAPEVEEEDASATHPMPDDTEASNDAQREVAAKFLPALWKAAAGDVTKFGELIGVNPLTSKFFDLTSPEVAAIVTEGA